MNRPLQSGLARRQWLAAVLAGTASLPTWGAGLEGAGKGAAQPAPEPGGGLTGERDVHDPTLWVDAQGGHWVFATGEGLARLYSRDGRHWERRPPVFNAARKPAWWAANRRGGIEAPTLVRHGAFVYLFMSWGLCCKGVDSTYEMRVGRSTSVRGPFVDRDGVPLLKGGGTLLLAGGPRWKGPGHQDLASTPAGDVLVWHAYDAESAGRPQLRRAVLRWDAAGAGGWPTLS